MMGGLTLRRILVLEGKALVCEIICGPPAWWTKHCPTWQSEPTASLLLSSKQLGAEISAGGLVRVVLGTQDPEQDVEVRLLSEHATLTLFAIVSRDSGSRATAADATEPRAPESLPALAHISATFIRLAGTASIDELKTALSVSTSVLV